MGEEESPFERLREEDGWGEFIEGTAGRPAMPFLGQALEFGRLKDTPHRVVWIAEQKKRGAVRDGLLKTIEVAFVPLVFLDVESLSLCVDPEGQGGRDF